MGALGFSTRELMIGVVLIAGLGLVTGMVSIPDGLLSATGPADEPGDAVRTGTSADLSLAAFDRAADSSTQVGVSNIYAWKDNGDRIYLGSSTGESSSRTTFSNFVVGDSYEAIAFDDTYEYGVQVSGAIDGADVLKNLDVHTEATSANVAMTVFDENGDSAASVDLGSDEQYSFDSVEVEVATSNAGYNPQIIAFDTADTDTNVSSIEMPNAESIAVPEAFSDSYDEAFKVYDAKQGAPLLGEWEKATSGNIVVTADADGTSGETLTIKTAALAPFIDQSDELAYGVQDDSDSPSFNSNTDSTTVTLN